MNNDECLLIIRFTVCKGLLSKTLCLFGHSYTHTAIATEPKKEFYSFNYKGFCIERAARKERFKSIYYCVRVDEENFQKVKRDIESMMSSKDKYKYNWIGLFSSFVGIPMHRLNKYYCSQFVANIIHESCSVSLAKDAVLYLPDNFEKELKCNPYFQRWVYAG